MMTEPAIGGCTVLEDPNKSGADTLVFWRPELLPGLVRLSPAPENTDPTLPRFDPWWGASRRAIHETGSGFHVALAKGPHERRFWIEGRVLPPPGAPLRALIVLDGDVDVQCAALKRFHRSVAGPDQPPDLTPYQIRMFVRALQVLDGHLDGASIRGMAVALFGADRMKDEWFRGSPLRDQVRYLIRRGLALMQGGYRGLLSDAALTRSAAKGQYSNKRIHTPQ